MDAREYLGQVRRLRIKIEQKQKQIESKTGAYSFIRGGVTGDAERVQTSPSLKAGFERSAIEIADLQAKLESDINEYQLLIYEVVETIHKVNNSNYLLILYAKWIDGHSLERIAADMHYTFGYVRKLYWKSMNEIQRILDQGEEE